MTQITLHTVGPPQQGKSLAVLEGTPDFVATLRNALADRYSIEREIGRGGMALVFLARDIKHDRNVAVKALRPELSKAVAQVDRFQKEIRITARLQHPHVLALFDSGFAGDLFYYVMPYVEGETLRTRLLRERKLSLDDTVRLARDVASALAHAHAQGLVHRDVKPENILLTKDNVLLADFGIARVDRIIPGETGPSGTSHSRVVVGTPGYMSPEQASGVVDVGPESDVYSLACVVCEMLGAEVPFTMSTPEQVLDATTKKDFVSGASVTSTATRSLRRVLRRALEPDRKKRYQTIGEFSVELKKAADSRPHPWRVAAVVATAVVGIVLVRQAVLSPRLDPTRYMLAPFIDSPLMQDSMFYRKWQYQWESVMRRIPDVKVEESTRVADQVLRRGKVPTTLSDVLAISRAIGAGRVVVTRAVSGRDSTEIRAEVYDVGNGKSVSRAEVAIPLVAPDVRSMVRLAEGLFGLPSGAISQPGRVSDNVAQEFAAGRAALESWDLPSAEAHFRHTVDLDVGYAEAHFWLAKVKAWAGHPANQWVSSARSAASDADRLADEKERALAKALLAMGEGRYPQACVLYDSILGTDSLSFEAWYGRGECRAKDDFVLPDASSPTGYRYRTGYHTAALAFERALAFVPSFAGVFRPLQRLRILFTETHRLRPGFGVPPDTVFYAAYPSLENDTLAFRPFPARLLRTAPPVPSTLSAAVALNRERLRRILQGWVAAFPSANAAYQDLAVLLELSGTLDGSNAPNRSALSAIRRARLDSPTASDSLAAATVEVRILLKLQRYRDAQALALSALAAARDPDPSQAERLAPLAVLVGHAHEAARLSAMTAPLTADGFDPTYRGLAIPILETVKRLSVYTGVGGPRDSMLALSSRLETVVPAYAAPDRARTLWCSSLFWKARAYSFPQLRRSSERPGCPPTYLLQMQQAVLNRDSTGVRSAFSPIVQMRLKSNVGPAELPPDLFFQEAWLLAEVGDTAAAIEHLSRFLTALPLARSSIIDREPSESAGLVRVMALMADLSARSGDVVTARGWAGPVTILWSDSDPELQGMVARMKRILAGEKAG